MLKSVWEEFDNYIIEISDEKTRNFTNDLMILAK